MAVWHGPSAVWLVGPAPASKGTNAATRACPVQACREVYAQLSTPHSARRAGDTAHLAPPLAKQCVASAPRRLAVGPRVAAV